MASTLAKADLSAPPSLVSLRVPRELRSQLVGFLTTARSGASLFDLEGMLRSLLRSVATFLLELLSEALEARDRRLGRPACPDCRQPMHRNRSETLALQLLEGQLDLPRRYWECRPCRQYLHPLDHELGLPRDGGGVAPRFGHDLCRLGVELPYATGSQLLAVLTGRNLDPGTIRNQVLREGHALVELETREAEVHSANLEPRERQRQLAALPPLRRPPFPQGILMVELDGAMANCGADGEVQAQIRTWEEREAQARSQGQPFEVPKPSVFREVLQARFYRLQDAAEKTTRSGKLRRQILHSETVSVVNDPDRFRGRIYAVGEAWRAHRYDRVAALGDGAIFDRNLHDGLRPDIEVLDFRHAKGHIYECGRAAFGEESREAKGWAKRWSDALWEHGPDPLLDELARLVDAKAAEGLPEGVPKKIQNLLNYVARHRQRMRYPFFRQLGLPIASGAIESTNRQVLGDRCKRSGMCWKRSSLQALLSLRACLKSGNWDLACAAIRSVRCLPKLVPATDRIEAGSSEPEPAAPTPPEPPKVTPTPRRRSLVPERKLAARLANGLLQRIDGELAIGERAA